MTKLASARSLNLGEKAATVHKVRPGTPDLADGSGSVDRADACDPGFDLVLPCNVYFEFSV